MSDSNAHFQKLWDYCNILRNSGLSYGDNGEQLTVLLFLKMVSQRYGFARYSSLERLAPLAAEAFPSSPWYTGRTKLRFLPRALPLTPILHT